MIILKNSLNLDQSPEELNDLYNRDYYWYLRSQHFCDKFLKRIGTVASMLGTLPKKVLDVGCGEGQLAQYVECGYHGFDGSESAISRAKNRYRDQPLYFEVARLEEPPITGCTFTVAVFGGILEVLIKPEERKKFIYKYACQYDLRYFIVYDLERLYTGDLELIYELIGEYYGSVDEMNNLPDVKRHRKVLIFKV